MNKKHSGTAILLFGFSGSGKSAIADLLGKNLGCQVIHASKVFTKVVFKGRKYPHRFWETEKGIQAMKNIEKHKEANDIITREIEREIKNQRCVITEGWLIPFCYEQGMCIYLKCSKAIRMRRVAQRNKLSPERAQKIIAAKENSTLEILRRICGISKRPRFEKLTDYTVDSSKLSKQEIVKRIMRFLQQKIPTQ